MKKYYIFDETAIDDGKTLFKSIRERRSSEDGIKHVIQASESALSSGISFLDSTTPFRVFILQAAAEHSLTVSEDSGEELIVWRFNRFNKEKMFELD